MSSEEERHSVYKYRQLVKNLYGLMGNIFADSGYYGARDWLEVYDRRNLHIRGAVEDALRMVCDDFDDVADIICHLLYEMDSLNSRLNKENEDTEEDDVEQYLGKDTLNKLAGDNPFGDSDEDKHVTP